MHATIEAMTDGKNGKKYFQLTMSDRRVQQIVPRILSQHRKNHEDRHTEWLTAQSINDSIDVHKNDTLEIRFVKNVPGYICEYFILFNFSKYLYHNNSLTQYINFPPQICIKSVVTFERKDNIFWIFNFDESEHKLGTKDKEGI